MGKNILHDTNPMLHWEDMDDYTQKAAIPGGWLIRSTTDLNHTHPSGICFIPDPDHNIIITDEEKLILTIKNLYKMNPNDIIVKYSKEGDNVILELKSTKNGDEPVYYQKCIRKDSIPRKPEPGMTILELLS